MENNKELLKIVENIYSNQENYSDYQQLNTLIDLYNIAFVNDNNFHTKVRELYVGKEFHALEVIEKEIFNLVRSTDSMYQNTSSEKVLEIANKLFVEKKDGLFPGFMANFVSLNEPTQSTNEKIQKSLLGLIDNDKITVGYSVKAIIANTIKPGYNQLSPVKLSNYAPDGIHFELEDLHYNVNKSIDATDTQSPEEWLGLSKVNKHTKENNTTKNESNDESNDEINEFNFTFERFKTGKPKYNLLSATEKIYASITVGDIKTLQSVLYNRDFLKEINLNDNDNLAYKLSEKLDNSENSEKIRTFLKEFVTTETYKSTFRDDSGKVREKALRCHPSSVLKDKDGKKYDKRIVQKDWDMILLDKYKNNPNDDILKTYEDFIAKHNLDKVSATRKDGSNTSYYRRVPNFALPGEFTVKDYVENYLPTTFNIISKKIDDEAKVSEIFESKEDGKRIQHPVESSFGVTYNRQEVQKVWDEKLIDTFFSKTGKMKEHYKMFLLELGITDQKLKDSGLLIHRMPLMWKEEHRESSTNFFVSNYIPKLGHLLRKHEQTLEEDKEALLKVIPKLKLRTEKTINDGNFQSDIEEIKDAKNEFKKAVAERSAYADFKDRSNGWSKTKR